MISGEVSSLGKSQGKVLPENYYCSGCGLNQWENMVPGVFHNIPSELPKQFHMCQVIINDNRFNRQAANQLFSQFKSRLNSWQLKQITLRFFVDIRQFSLRLIITLARTFLLPDSEMKDPILFFGHRRILKSKNYIFANVDFSRFSQRFRFSFIEIMITRRAKKLLKKFIRYYEKWHNSEVNKNIIVSIDGDINKISYKQIAQLREWFAFDQDYFQNAIVCFGRPKLARHRPFTYQDADFSAINADIDVAQVIIGRKFDRHQLQTFVTFMINHYDEQKRRKIGVVIEAKSKIDSTLINTLANNFSTPLVI